MCHGKCGSHANSCNIEKSHCGQGVDPVHRQLFERLDAIEEGIEYIQDLLEAIIEEEHDEEEE